MTHTPHGDPTVNSNWQGYGSEVGAVSDGTIVNIRDGLPDGLLGPPTGRNGLNGGIAGGDPAGK